MKQIRQNSGAELALGSVFRATVFAVYTKQFFFGYFWFSGADGEREN